MNKMQMAHEFMMKKMETETIDNHWELFYSSWRYADAMQTEAEKREPSGLPEALLTKDKDGKCKHFHHEFGHKKCMDCGASLEDWQPDWSQAPEGYNYWVATADHNGKISGGWFYDVKPEIGKSDVVSIYYSSNSNAVSTESFNYQGKWQDSLRKRPEALLEVDWRVAPEWANYWAVREDSNTALWCINKPTVTCDCFLSHGGCSPAPSFGFKGSHIVERPNGF